MGFVDARAARPYLGMRSNGRRGAIRGNSLSCADICVLVFTRMGANESRWGANVLMQVAASGPLAEMAIEMADGLRGCAGRTSLLGDAFEWAARSDSREFALMR